MKFVTLDGKQVTINIRESKAPVRSQEKCRSALQWYAGEEIRSMFPRFLILEEFPIPGARLFLDFFLPNLMLAVEVDGAQHGMFSKFFHVTQEGFVASKKRDAEKEKWCHINNITLVRIQQGDNVSDRIREAISRTA